MRPNPIVEGSGQEQWLLWYLGLRIICHYLFASFIGNTAGKCYLSCSIQYYCIIKTLSSQISVVGIFGHFSQRPRQVKLWSWIFVIRFLKRAYLSITVLSLSCYQHCQLFSSEESVWKSRTIVILLEPIEGGKNHVCDQFFLYCLLNLLFIDLPFYFLLLLRKSKIDW